MIREPEGRPARFFHASVRNLHRERVARECYVYMTHLVHVDSGAVIPLKTVEFKWAGYRLPNAAIAPQSSRDFDAVWFFHEQPEEPQFNLFTDSGRYLPRLRGPGDYEIRFEVLSEGFPSCERTFLLRVSETLDETRIEPSD
jgi:hypothetical protein